MGLAERSFYGLPGSQPSRPRLLLLTVGELADDPRASRAATAGVARGLSVSAACIAVDLNTATPPSVRVIRVGPGATTKTLRSLGLGGSRQRGALWRELRGTYRLGRQLLETLRLAHAVRVLEPQDIVHANDFDTLPAGFLIARRSRARIIYDAHEIYTSQEPDPPKIYTAIVRRIERHLARRVDAVVTVSDAIADELKHRMSLSRQPYVVLNCPPLVDAVPMPRKHKELRVIYQGAWVPVDTWRTFSTRQHE